MKNELYEQMYSEYKEGYSLSEVGRMFGMTRQSVYEGFRIREYKMRGKKFLPYLFFDSVKFTLRNNGYYGKTFGDRELIQRYIWRSYNGRIPVGYDIHHRDRNKENNEIKNLELISKSEHSRRFATGNNQYSKTKNISRKT